MGRLRVGRQELWSDATQDIIDEGLEKLGFSYERKYNNIELKQFLDKAINDKKLWNKFEDIGLEEFNKQPTKVEFKNHIITTLGYLSPIGRAIDYRKKLKK